MDVLEFFLTLIKCTVNKTELSTTVKEKASFSLFKDAFVLARKHDLGHLIYQAAESFGVLPDADNDEEKEFLKSALECKYNAVARYIAFETEAKRINNILNGSQTEHVFLKGTELRSLYPDKWLRTSSDIDVLIHRKDLKMAINALTQNGYEQKSGVQFHDVSLFHGMVHLELHHSIMVTVDSLNRVLSEVWDHTEDFDRFQKKMDQSFFVFHQIAHAAYHFANGGCGFRPFIDLWLLEKQGYDHDEVMDLCKKAQIEKFYKRTQQLIRIYFDGIPFDPESIEMTDFILGIGEYEQFDSINSLNACNKSKMERIQNYVFVPYKDLVEIYPGAEHKILVPFYQMKRWADRIFVQKKIGRAVKRMKTMKTYDNDTTEKIKRLRNISGLENIL